MVGFTSNQAKKDICEFKDILVKHLRHQDDELYPFLNDVAKIKLTK